MPARAFVIIIVIVIVALGLSEIARSPCAARTSGVDASAFGADAPVAAEIAWQSRARVAKPDYCDVRYGQAGYRHCVPRNIEGPPGLPGRPFSTR
jgi:hypothetical protein